MTGTVSPPPGAEVDASSPAHLGADGSVGDGGGARHHRLGRHGPWLRWSGRDLRKRWLQVAAIALVAALGTGTYTGLTASTAWRRVSYDKSFAALDAHTLDVSLATGTTVAADQLVAAASTTAHREWIEAVSPQYIVPVQVDASTGSKTILVPGRVVGVDLRDGGPSVDRFDVRSGRALTDADTGQSRAVVDAHFAQQHNMPAAGTLRLGGDRVVDYVGHVLEPEYFLIVGEQGGFFADASYAVLFMPLADAQQIGGVPNAANRLVVKLADGVDVVAAQAELSAALNAAIPGAAMTVAPLSDDRAYRLLYDDIDGDQRFYRIFALLILAGAAFAAFNLASRIVEAQRREIGVSMALGVPPGWIALRPLLVGLEVALLGMAFGVGIGLLIGRLMSSLLVGFFPMPVWETPFQAGVYLQGAVLSVALIFLATISPVLRAIRVVPVEAIQVGLRETKSSGWARAARRLPLPGSTIVQMPLRNALRSPRRTMLTALGIAAAIATLVAVLGMVDSFVATVDGGEREALRGSSDRIEVGLEGFQVSGSPTLQQLARTPGVASTSEGLRVVGHLSASPADFDVVIEVIDLANPIWTPSVVEGTTPGVEPAVLISKKAAEDLGVEVGGTVRLRHPFREGLGHRWVESDLRVAGIHPNPYRFMVYVDQAHASLMNLDGIVNLVQIKPAPGATVEGLQRALFTQAGVSAVQPVAATTQGIRSRIDQVLDVLDIIMYAVLLLAILIAFNSSSISADERAREQATLSAFGVPLRTTLGMSIAESALVGVVATVIGLVVGVALLQWIVRVQLSETMPDLYIEIAVRRFTVVLAGFMGVVAVAAAPLLTFRRLRRMRVPETLRVVE